MLKKFYISCIFFFIVSVGVPTVVVACGYSKSCEKSCCSKKEKKSEKKSCCAKQTSPEEKDCGGKCGDSNCDCGISYQPIIISSIPSYQINNKIKKTKFIYQNNYITSEFNFIWLPPKIG